MKYIKPTLTYLDEATTVIQGVNTGSKSNPTLSDSPLPSSTIGAYEVDE
jgi:hypothetical protein